MSECAARSRVHIKSPALRTVCGSRWLMKYSPGRRPSVASISCSMKPPSDRVLGGSPGEEGRTVRYGIIRYGPRNVHKLLLIISVLKRRFKGAVG